MAEMTETDVLNTITDNIIGAAITAERGVKVEQPTLLPTTFRGTGWEGST
jgi:hypothetical protein